MESLDLSMGLVRRVEQLGSPRVLVVGDLILDRYVWGDAERISQEAPVILLRADRREERLGGAASVAMMLATLGAKVSLAGVVGEDAPAQRCRELLDSYGIAHELVQGDPSRPTTLKERYIGRAQHKHPQQMMRVDYETREIVGGELEQRLLHAMRTAAEDHDIVLVSDYDKGVCSPNLVQQLITACRSNDKRILVDPIRGGDYAQRYRGCHAMTPNRLEAGLAVGRTLQTVEEALDAADQLKQSLGMEVGLVTMDSDGMVLVDANGRRQHFPVRARQVYDITGAGDMVLAVLGMVLAAGGSFPEAIQLANTAGGLVVERIGVATVTREEIIADILQGLGHHNRKVLTKQALQAALAERRRGKKIVFTNGCFDILHVGHVQLLREAKAQGDLLVLGLNSDASVRRLKGSTRPINDQESRCTVLSALDCVDYVCVFEEDTPEDLIHTVSPDVLVKGGDYRPEEVVGREYVESIGGRVHLVPLVAGKSTTRTLALLEGPREAA